MAHNFNKPHASITQSFAPRSPFGIFDALLYGCEQRASPDSLARPKFFR